MTTTAKKTVKKGLAKPTEKKTEARKVSKTWEALQKGIVYIEVVNPRIVAR